MNAASTGRSLPSYTHNAAYLLDFPGPLALMMRPLYAAPPFFCTPPPKAPKSDGKRSQTQPSEAMTAGWAPVRPVWLAEILTLNCGGDAHHPELARPDDGEG